MPGGVQDVSSSYLKPVGIESESLAQLCQVQTKIGRVASVRTVLISWCVFTPGYHSSAGLGSQFFAQEVAKLLHNREWIALESRELDIKKTMLISSGAKRHHSTHSEFAKLCVHRSQPELIDLVGEGLMV